MGDSMITIAVLFDLSKAFDSVILDILIHKLKAMGFANSVIDWITSYLKGRLQAVRVDNIGMSAWKETISGVPQGSVLGPLFYSIYVIDLGALLKRCKHLFYADDLAIYLNCKTCDINSCITTPNDEIKII